MRHRGYCTLGIQTGPSAALPTHCAVCPLRRLIVRNFEAVPSLRSAPRKMPRPNWRSRVSPPPPPDGQTERGRKGLSLLCRRPRLLLHPLLQERRALAPLYEELESCALLRLRRRSGPHGAFIMEWIVYSSCLWKYTLGCI